MEENIVAEGKAIICTVGLYKGEGGGVIAESKAMTFLAGVYQIMEREKMIIAEGKAVTCPTGLHKIRGESSLQKSKLDFPSTVVGFYQIMEREKKKIIAEGKAITCPTRLYKSHWGSLLKAKPRLAQEGGGFGFQLTWRLCIIINPPWVTLCNWQLVRPQLLTRQLWAVARVYFCSPAHGALGKSRWTSWAPHPCWLIQSLCRHKATLKEKSDGAVSLLLT